jgi:dihydroneopterin aldolase
MKTTQPADSRALIPDESSHCDEDEIGALLRHALVEETTDAIVSERWNTLAERIVADLQDQLEKDHMEVHCTEVRRLGLTLRSWSSLTVRLA